MTQEIIRTNEESRIKKRIEATRVILEEAGADGLQEKYDPTRPDDLVIRNVQEWIAIRKLRAARIETKRAQKNETK